MTRTLLILAALLLSAGCNSAKKATPPPAGSPPPPAKAQPAAEPEPAKTPEPVATTEAAPHEGTDHVEMNGTDSSYTAKTDDGYIVVVSPSPSPLAAGLSTWAIEVTAPAGADIAAVELEAEIAESESGKKIESLKLTPGDPGKGTLEWTIPGPGSYEVEVHVDRGSAGDSHAMFMFTLS